LLCVRAQNCERGAVLCEYFGDGLSYLPVVAYACHQGNFSLKNDRPASAAQAYHSRYAPAASKPSEQGLLPAEGGFGCLTCAH